MEVVVTLANKTKHTIRYEPQIARSVRFMLEEDLLFYEGMGMPEDFLDNIKEINIKY